MLIFSYVNSTFPKQAITETIDAKTIMIPIEVLSKIKLLFIKKLWTREYSKPSMPKRIIFFIILSLTILCILFNIFLLYEIIGILVFFDIL